MKNRMILPHVMEIKAPAPYEVILNRGNRFARVLAIARFRSRAR